MKKNNAHVPLSIQYCKIIFFIVFMFLPGATVGAAQHIAMVITIPESSDMICPGTKTLLDIAKNKALARIDEELILDPQTQISITSNTVHIQNSNDRQQLRKTIKSIYALSQPLDISLETALNTLPAIAVPHAEKQQIIIYSSRQDTGQILQLLSQAEQQGVAVHFHLFQSESTHQPSTHKISSAQHFTFQTFGCPSPASKFLSGWEQKILLQIRQSTAQHLGGKLQNVTPSTDLITDLGADTYRAYEVLALLCEEQSVPMPQNKNLTTINQIFKYIRIAKKQKTRGAGPALNKSYKKDIYYATDRNITGNVDPGNYFGTMRTSGSDLSYGFCTVSIPESHRPGQIESPFLGLEFLESTSDHVVLMQIDPLSKKDMMSRIQGTVSPKPNDPTAHDILIFIHGFNQSFAMAAKRTAQIAVDLDFRGTPFMFSWPSNNSLFDYWPDREDIAWSVAHVEQLFLDLHRKFPNKGLHVIAHSMGNQALIGALNRLALHRSKAKQPFFKNIILAAPDFDARLFQEQIAPEVVGLAANWSVYASDNDAALIYSGDINEAKRLGIPLTTLEGINVIDASGVEVTPWSVPEFHSYYATKMVVIRDMTKSLKGLPPKIRELIPRPEHPFLWLLKLPKIVHKAGKEIFTPAEDIE